MTMSRSRNVCSLCCHFVLMLLFQGIAFAQDGPQALGLVRELAHHVSSSNADAILAEIEHFIHGTVDPATEGELLALKGLVLKQTGKSREAALLILRAKCLYGYHSTETFRAFAEALSAKSGILRNPTFTDSQKNMLSSLYDTPFEKALSFSGRGKRFLRALRSVVEPGLGDVFVKEADWFLSHNPTGEGTDSCRFWLGEVLSLQGNRMRAWETFYSVLKLYPSSPLAPSCYIRAADELTKKPVWDFRGALSLLTSYLEEFPADPGRGKVFWRAAELTVRRLKEPDLARVFVDSLLRSYGPDLREPEIVFELGQLFMKSRDYGRAKQYLDQFVRLAPESKRIKDARKLLRRVRVETARPE